MHGNPGGHRRWAPGLLAMGMAACLAAVPAAARGAAHDVTQDAPNDIRILDELLPRLDPRHVLRVTMLSREVVEGHLGPARGDTLWLSPRADGDGSLAPVPMRKADIVRLEQRRSGVDRGSRVGAGSGAAVGGVLGLLFGLWISSWSDDVRAVPVVLVSGMGGAAAGGAAGGIFGAGVGATGSYWYTLWPDHETARALRAEQAQARADSLAALKEPTVTRILVEAGYAATGGPWDMTGAAFGAGLLGEPRAGLQLGPVMRFHGLDGVADVRPTMVSGDQTRLEPIMSLSFDARLSRPDAGWRPLVQAGLGLSLSTEVYPSAHIGLGLRERDGRGRDWGLVIGRHFMLGDVADAAHGQWAATLVFSFAP